MTILAKVRLVLDFQGEGCGVPVVSKHSEYWCAVLDNTVLSFPAGESGGAVFLERRYRFFQVRSRIWRGLPARAQVLARGMWVTFEGNQRGQGLE